MQKSLRQVHFLLLLNPFSGPSHCTVQGAPWNLCSAQPEQLYAYPQLYGLHNIDHTVVQSEWGGKKKCHGEITLVNVSKILPCHLRKLQKKEVPMRLDCYLEVRLEQYIKGVCEPSSPCLTKSFPQSYHLGVPRKISPCCI